MMATTKVFWSLCVLTLSLTYYAHQKIVIYPVDFETNGHIVDDLMHDIMVKPLPPGCRMTAIFDVSLRLKFHCEEMLKNIRI